MNTTCLRIFDALNDSVGADRIFTLGGGDIFTFDGAFYEVLSPARNEPFPFDAILTEAVENLNICLSSPFHTGRETEFLETKDAFVRLYMQCQTAFAPSDRATPGRRRILLDSLRDLLGRMEDMRSNLAHSPAAPDIQDILNQSVVRNVYTETQNDLSLVFHNRRSRGPSNLDILMTGDVSDEVLRRISGKLFDGYYIVKAPHHAQKATFQTSSATSPLRTCSSPTAITTRAAKFPSATSIWSASSTAQTPGHAAGATSRAGAATACNGATSSPLPAP